MSLRSDIAGAILETIFNTHHRKDVQRVSMAT